MKALLHTWNAGESLLSRYEAVAAHLRANGHEADVVWGVGPTELRLAGYGMVLSHFELPASVRQQLPGKVFGGRRWTRAEQLLALNQAGFPTMEWMQVNSKVAALALFDTWGVDKLIVKRSFTAGGGGFHVVTPGQARYGDWDLSRDIICREVNPNDGNTYKVELFNGRILISYVLKKRPLSERLLAGDLDADGFRRLALYRDPMERPDERHRELFEFPDADRVVLRQLSRRMTDIGLGYVCVDLMRKPDASFVAIELNLSGVTTWWTERAAFLRTRFADAVLTLVQTL
jgi:hypothetical protein